MVVVALKLNYSMISVLDLPTKLALEQKHMDKNKSSYLLLANENKKFQKKEDNRFSGEFNKNKRYFKSKGKMSYFHAKRSNNDPKCVEFGKVRHTKTEC